MPQDWLTWHDLYQTEVWLQQRLQLVQGYIVQSLNAQPPGQIRVVSLCAGDGRDLLGALQNHSRKADVEARLVELSPQLVERGRASFAAAGLAEQVEFVQGDATLSTSYAGAVPADVVLICGVLGNLADAAALQQLIGNLRYLARPGASVVWTRGHQNGVAYSDLVRQSFQSAQFAEVEFQLTATGNMGVGLHQFQGEAAPLPSDTTLFVFSGTPERAGTLA